VVGTGRQFPDDRYRLIRRCAGLAGADVYLALDTLLDRRVVIRWLREDLEDRDAQVDRLHREATALAAVESPHVANVLDLRLGASAAYLVVHRPAGLSLGDVARLGPVPEERIVRWTGQILDGLIALHARRLVHLDLQSDDVVVTGADRVIIGGAITMSAGPGADPRADVFRTGLVLLQLATGIDPASVPRSCAAAFDDLICRIPGDLATIARRAFGLDAPFSSAAAMRAALGG